MYKGKHKHAHDITHFVDNLICKQKYNTCELSKYDDDADKI